MSLQNSAGKRDAPHDRPYVNRAGRDCQNAELRRVKIVNNSCANSHCGFAKYVFIRTVTRRRSGKEARTVRAITVLDRRTIRSFSIAAIQNQPLSALYAQCAGVRGPDRRTQLFLASGRIRDRRAESYCLSSTVSIPLTPVLRKVVY